MIKILTLQLFACLALMCTVRAGGTEHQIAVSGIEDAESGITILRFTQPGKGARSLYIRYNAARMRGVVSAKEHERALKALRERIARAPEITLGCIGPDFVKVSGTQADFASDALQILNSVIYAWPAKR